MPLIICTVATVHSYYEVAVYVKGLVTPDIAIHSIHVQTQEYLKTGTS